MKRTTRIANFNCTFGHENLPMLTYFDEIIFPAFTSDKVRTTKEGDYFFNDVKIKKTRTGRMILEGMLIRKTILEVKTEFDTVGGEVKYTNKSYDTAPISIFTLFLDNHRLLYTTNQKGSPSIISFSATIKYLIKIILMQYNESLEKENRIPYPAIDIVDIPSEKSIIEKLSDVKKISKLEFRFFNPNGDFGMSGIYDLIQEELEDLGSKRGKLTYNSPTKFDAVTEKVSATNGLAEVKMDVQFINGSSGRLDNESLSEKYTMNLPEDSTYNTIAKVAVDELSENDIIRKVDPENEVIYNKNIGKIEHYLS